MDGMNKHLGYAMTWATLSAFMSIMIYVGGRRKGNRSGVRRVTRVSVRGDV